MEARAPGGVMRYEDQMIVRAAARILDEYSAKLLDHYDPLAQSEGFVGYAASDAAAEIRFFLDRAEKCGLIQQVTA